MDSLRFYLDNMFKGLTDTQKVRNAKEELFAMMEDKYRQLIKEGKSENIAVGMVIADFGNLDELIETLGLENEVLHKSESLDLSSEYVDEYLENYQLGSKCIARGIALVLTGIGIMVGFAGLGEANYISESVGIAIGVSILMILIAIAVFHFIKGGMKLDAYDKLEKSNVNLLYKDRQKVLQYQKELNAPPKIALGVVLCIVAIIPSIVISLVADGKPGLEYIGVPFTLLTFAVAIYILTRTGMRSEAYKVLLQEGEYDLVSKEFKNRYEWINSTYWLLVIAGYLLYSWLTNNWSRSWIVWPIAGILFGVVQVVLKAKIDRENRQ